MRVFLPDYVESYSRQYKYEDEQIYNQDVIDQIKTSNKDLRPVFDGTSGAQFDAELYSLVAQGRGETGEVVRYSADAPFYAKAVTHDSALNDAAANDLPQYAAESEFTTD